MQILGGPLCDLDWAKEKHIKQRWAFRFTKYYKLYRKLWLDNQSNSLFVPILLGLSLLGMVARGEAVGKIY